jgi:hypothetical protein
VVTWDVTLSSWSLLTNCSSAEEVEAIAFSQGVRLLVEWIRLPAILETDYANLLDMSLLTNCSSAEEAEAIAFSQGVRLLVEWILETDYANLLDMLSSSHFDRSSMWSTIKYQGDPSFSGSASGIPSLQNFTGFEWSSSWFGYYAIRSKSCVVGARLHAPSVCLSSCSVTVTFLLLK